MTLPQSLKDAAEIAARDYVDLDFLAGVEWLYSHLMKSDHDSDMLDTKIRVIERAAYDSLIESLILAKKQRDEWESRYKEIMSYLLKVPTEPYEKELARKLVIAVKALEEISKFFVSEQPDRFGSFIGSRAVEIAKEALAKIKEPEYECPETKVFRETGI